MSRPTRLLASILARAALTTAVPAAAAAETLQEALAAAYETNPTLLGQRDQQRALDEIYVQAKVGWRPSLSGSVQAQYEKAPNSITDLAAGSSAGSYGYGALSLTQPLYTGGRTLWAVRAAEASVKAGREDLRAVEASVMFAVIQGYLDVLRDQQILGIRQADVATLQRQVAEAKAKFDLGQVTRTDVAQADAQYQAAVGALAAASGQLDVSRAEFAAAVGRPPGQLEDVAVLPGVPTSLGEATRLAQTWNPLLMQSLEQARASKAQVAQAKSGYRPTVGLAGTFGYIGPVAPPTLRDYGQDVTGGITVNLPILTGGLVQSQVRQASANDASAEMTIEITRRQVIQSVAQSWARFQANRAAAAAAEAQASAADLALRGVQAEYGYALRTTLDVLIADENLRAAQSTLAASRHDALLAEAAVLDAAGRLEAADLLPGQALYDPKANFDKVRRAGATPYEPVIQALDTLGAPRP
jgi:outer membrane protein